MSPTLKKYLTMFQVMFRIGLFTFGGGYAMLPQMSREFVEKHHWISKEEILDVFAVAQSLPGVVAVNTSVLVGYRIAKVPGALVAALGATLPSFIVLSIVTVGYQAFISNPYVAGAMIGIRAAVTGTLAATVLKIGKAPLQDLWGWCLFLIALALALFTDLNVIWIILGAALLGLGRHFFEKRRATSSGGDS